MYKLRKEKVERSFADSKNNHAYRYAMYRGVEKNKNYIWLICATQNMKNIAKKINKCGSIIHILSFKKYKNQKNIEKFRKYY